MVRSLVLGIAASALFASSPAAAETWWWVAGEPGGSEATFVDADSIAPDGTVRVLRLTADGGAGEEIRSVRCSKATSDAVESFVCADAEARLGMGAMLGSLTPEIAARAIFSTEG